MPVLLFQPDNFSNYKVVFQAVPDAEVLAISAVLGNYFAIFQVLDVKQLAATEINSNNFRVAVDVDGKKEVLLVRRFKILQDKRQIDFYLKLLDDLRKIGAKVSKVRYSRFGELFVGHANENYAIFDFLEAEHFAPTETAFCSVAKAVSVLHKSFQSLPSSVIAEIKKYSLLSKEVYYNKISNYSLADVDKLEKEIKMGKDEVEYRQEVLEMLPILRRYIREVADASATLSGLPLGAIHSDLHPHNVLMQNGAVAAIIDFDSMRISQPARDVAVFWYRFGRQFFINNDFSPEIFVEKISGLRELVFSSYQEINPLTKLELELMPLLLKDEFITKSLFVLYGIYREKNYQWTKDLPKFLMALKEIEIFFN